MGVYRKIKGLLTARTNQADKPNPKSEPFWDNWPRESLGQKLTNLLVDNGSSVNKQSILALKGFIAERDAELIEHAIKQHDRGIKQLEWVHNSLKTDTGVSDLANTDPVDTTDTANPPKSPQRGGNRL
jgi:hypothetical protein